MNNIEELCIYDLRNYARYVGVKAPTTKKRAVLISEINKILTKDYMPVQNKKSGRRTKSIALKIIDGLPTFGDNNLNMVKELVVEIFDMQKVLDKKIDGLLKSIDKLN